MSTVRDLIKDALRAIGVLASGETPSADELSDAIRSLNRMLDGWSTERLIVYIIPKRSVSLVGGQQVYSVGSGGNWDIARPQRVEYATVIQAGDDSEIPVELINYHEWANITQKNIQSTIPTKLYLEGSFPLDYASVYPVPSAGATLNLYVWEPLTAFTNASDEVSFPPGYEDAIVYNLAKRLASEYGVGVPAEINMDAINAKERIKRVNHRPKEICSNPTGGGKRYNVRTGE